MTTAGARPPWPTVPVVSPEQLDALEAIRDGRLPKVAQAQIEALRARNAELRAALAPFVNGVDGIAPVDYRRARAALAVSESL